MGTDRQFLDEDFLLQSDTARRLYHDHAEKMPIYDYHCHLPAEKIAADHRFGDLTEGRDGVEGRRTSKVGRPVKETMQSLKAGPQTERATSRRWSQEELAKVVKVPELCRLLSVSRTTLHRMRQGDFPRPIQVGSRGVVWRYVDVIEWLERKSGEVR